MHDDWALTHTSFVNEWQCDQNRHMNVQFYWQHFAQAAACHAALTGTDRTGWTHRHVRYLAELHSGSPTLVMSRAEDGERLIHHLRHGETGQVCATAVDSTGETTATDDAFAAPRSVEAGPVAPQDGGALATRYRVEPGECDADGRLSDRALIGHFSDGAPGIWLRAGYAMGQLHGRGFGSVVVEMKVSRLSEGRPAAGTTLEMISTVEESGPKTLSIRHFVRDLADGTPRFAAALTALVMDLETRRAVPLPTPDRPAATIYKIVARDEWEAAVRAGRYDGAPIDARDGFIHFSTARQAGETLAKHFRGRTDLVLVAVDARRLDERLRWEVSRGGALFPHLYAPLAVGNALWVRPILDRPDGSHELPDLGPERDG